MSPGEIDEREDEREEVGNDAEQVDDVHDALDEAPLLRRRDEADQVLDREPPDEDGLGDGEEKVLLVAALLL